MDGIDELEKIGDDAEQVREIGRRLGDIPVFQERLRKMRQAAVLRMKASGLSYQKIGDEIGLHRNRVQQIAEGSTSGGKGGTGGELPVGISERVENVTAAKPKGRTRYVVQVAERVDDVIAALAAADLEKNINLAGVANPVEVSTLSRTTALRVHDVLNAAGLTVIEPPSV